MGHCDASHHCIGMAGPFTAVQDTDGWDVAMQIHPVQDMAV